LRYTQRLRPAALKKDAARPWQGGVKGGPAAPQEKAEPPQGSGKTPIPGYFRRGLLFCQNKAAQFPT